MSKSSKSDISKAFQMHRLVDVVIECGKSGNCCICWGEMSDLGVIRAWGSEP